MKRWNKSNTKIKSPNKNKQTQQQRISVNRNAMNYYVYVYLPFSNGIYSHFVCLLFCLFASFEFLSSLFHLLFLAIIMEYEEVKRSLGVCNEVLNRWVHSHIEPWIFHMPARVCLCVCLHRVTYAMELSYDHLNFYITQLICSQR